MFFINPQDFFKNNKKYFKLGLCLIIVFVSTIIFYRSSDTINLLSFFKKMKDILAPFIYGIGIAYILNPCLKFIENKILIKSNYISQKQNLKRCLSISATYIILFSFLVWLISYIIPEIKVSVQDISLKLKNFDISTLERTLKDIFPFKEEIFQEIFNNINVILNGIFNILSETLTKFINDIPNILNTIISSTFGIFTIILNVILGIVISIYILFDKENIATFSKRIIFALSSKKFAQNIIQFCKNSNDTFEKFFVGKIIDSIIIGIIFFIGSLIINPPFKLLLSIIIGVTNIIPFFGPFIGGIPVVFITFIGDISSPEKALFIAIFILALQQFDGNILGPKILGDSIGVKPLGIIFSIIIAGELFGPAGMFFGVPVFAVIFNLFDNYIQKKYNNKYNNQNNKIKK